MADKQYTSADYWEALGSGDVDKVDSVLEANPDLVNQPDDRGFPPVVLIAYRDQVAILDVLGKYKVDLNATDSSGNSALMGAIFKGNQKAIDWLIENGADVNVQNPEGATALSFAYDYQRIGVFEALLSKGANPNLTNPSGNSIGAHAAANGPEWAKNLINQYT